MYVSIVNRLAIRSPIRIEITSPAENISVLDKDLHEILRDASSSCEFTSFIDDSGETLVKIECMVNEEEKERAWDLLRFKHRKTCHISSEPTHDLSSTL